MIDLQDKYVCPSLEDLGTFVRNPVFNEFCSDIKDRYKCKEKIEFSSCSWEPGWNIKFRKAGKTLCTVYPRESYFTVLVVIGRAEKAGQRPFCRSALLNCSKYISRRKREMDRNGL